jgi:hypothetical protein
VAIDAETKLVPCFRVGKRTKAYAIAFMTDRSERLRSRDRRTVYLRSLVSSSTSRKMTWL